MEALLGTCAIALKKQIGRDAVAMSRWSIYPQEIAACELSSSQGLLLALLRNLAEGHSQACHVLAGLARGLPQLRSTYLKVWLADDFAFCKEWIAEAFSNAGAMVRSRGLSLDAHLIAAFSRLPSKYDLEKYFTIRGDHLTLEFVTRIKEGLGLSSPNNDIPLTRIHTWNSSFSLGKSHNPDKNELNNQLLEAENDTSIEAVNTGLRAGADPVSGNSSEETALNQAVLSGNTEVVRALLTSGAEVNRAPGTPPLCLAATLGKEDMVALLLMYLADPNAVDHEGFNSLHRAVMGGYVEIAKYLIDRGANVGQRTLDSVANTPLHLAVDQGHLRMVQMLMESGADLKARDGCGWTPLKSAILNSHHSIVAALLASGCDFNDCLE